MKIMVGLVVACVAFVLGLLALLNEVHEYEQQKGYWRE